VEERNRDDEEAERHPPVRERIKAVAYPNPKPVPSKPGEKEEGAP